MQFRITITGTAELLMHNARLANPLDSAAKAMKAISSKRVKTDEDHAEMARLEHFGSLYYDSEIGPYTRLGLAPHHLAGRSAEPPPLRALAR